METHKPHYPLGTIQDGVAKRKAAAFPKAALDDGRAMGLTTEQMLQVVAGLCGSDFYKSMTTHHDHSVWRDAYHAHTSCGEADIKLTLRDHAPVIQFKER